MTLLLGALSNFRYRTRQDQFPANKFPPQRRRRSFLLCYKPRYYLAALLSSTVLKDKLGNGGARRRAGRKAVRYGCFTSYLIVVLVSSRRIGVSF